MARVRYLFPSICWQYKNLIFIHILSITKYLVLIVSYIELNLWKLTVYHIYLTLHPEEDDHVEYKTRLADIKHVCCLQNSPRLAWEGSCSGEPTHFLAHVAKALKVTFFSEWVSKFFSFFIHFLIPWFNKAQNPSLIIFKEIFPY